jgi:Na+-translocating ferredoxin:NAD+ oxidoreductase RnfG subunit
MSETVDSFKQMELEKLKLELAKLKEPWWKKTFGKLVAALVAALGAAIITLVISYVNTKEELREKPSNIKSEIVKAIGPKNTTNENNDTDTIIKYSIGYATGVLKSKSGKLALKKAIESKNEDEVLRIIQNIVGQTVSKVVEKIE